jgi:transcriptional regulator with XRE-family HTH domain
MTQKQLAGLAGMAQPRISKMERPGEEAFNIDTLIRLAAAFQVGLKVEFVPFSEMLVWENNYSQDQFNPPPLSRDVAFLHPPEREPAVVEISPQYFYRDFSATRTWHVHMKPKSIFEGPDYQMLPRIPEPHAEGGAYTNA